MVQFHVVINTSTLPHYMLNIHNLVTSSSKFHTFINHHQFTMNNQLTMNQEEKSRIVFFPAPFQGHISPMMQLASLLHTKGFSISILHTEYKFPDTSKYPHFTFHTIPDGLSESKEDLTDPLLVIDLLNISCPKLIQKCLHQLVSDYPVKCLITDTNWHCVQAVADDLELPRIVIRTASVCSFLAFAALTDLRKKGYITDQESRMEEPVHELPPLKIKDIPSLKTRNPDDLFTYTARMMEESKKAKGLIFNTFKELEGPELAKISEQFTLPTFSVGPFHKCFSAASSSLLTHDRSSITWLDKQAPKSVLYVSFGSVALMDPQKLEEVASGLVSSKQPFLWAIRPGLVQGCEWIEALPDELLELVKKQGYVVKWAPQQEVLSHPSVGGFWTHSGWNSTLESICEGVPMVCSPFLGDQMVNSRYVSDVWKIGIKLERGLKREEIENAIRKLMVEGEEMRQRSMSLKEKTDSCLRYGGSSYQSLDDLVNFILSFK